MTSTERPEGTSHRIFRWFRQLDANTWAQIGLTLLLAFSPIIVGSLFENEWVRLNVDKISWILWAAASGLFVVAVRSKPLPARLVSLSLAVLIAGYALHLQTAQPWCATAGVSFTVVEEARQSEALRVVGDTVPGVQQNLRLLIAAAPRYTPDSGVFTGWGSICSLSKLDSSDGQIVTQAPCQMVYQMGRDDKTDDIVVRIERPSCGSRGQTIQQLRLFPVTN
ncbi:MAG: hypothetical protein HGA45_29725 [Chloroflexales bacterium]|nr:hypothetical protein [Chloroflexales bacterium]